MYSMNVKLKDIRSELEYMQQLMQEAQLIELVRRSKKMKS